jgi:hypothetical protein
MENNKQHCATGLDPQCTRPTRAFRPSRPKQGTDPLPHRRSAHRPIPASRQREAGQGGLDWYQFDVEGLTEEGWRW